MKKSFLSALLFDFVIVCETAEGRNMKNRSISLSFRQIHSFDAALVHLPSFVHLFSLQKTIILCVLIFVLITSGVAIVY